MTNGGNYPGTLTLGDLDIWTFTANVGDSVNLWLGATTDGMPRYGPNHVLVNSAVDNADEPISFTPTNSGIFTVLVSSYFAGGTGTYALHLAQIPENPVRLFRRG